MTITIKKEIPNDCIVDILIDAFENACNHWCIVEGYYPSRWGEQIENGCMKVKVYNLIYESNLLGTVTEQSIRKGIRLMMEDYPESYGRWMEGQYDADDADIFLQLVTMGEIVFG